uniref:Lipocalin/cytosolic fatty-acid binding domain-containing protein n=1 Tax=Arion vulgaris TaxID=1028688 RepID=A0A0B6ZW55_9EUPU
MDPSFFGSWKLDQTKSTGVEQLGKALGMDDDKIQLFKNMVYTYTIVPEGNGYRITTEFEGGIPKQELVINIGQAQEYTTLDGEKAKITVNINGKAVVENHDVLSKNHKLVVTRTVNGNIMSLAIEASGVVATAALNRIS